MSPVVREPRPAIVNGMGVGDGASMPLVVEVASRFGLRTIAEGVETAEQESMARELGVDELQGFGIAPPMSRSQLVDALQGRSNFRAPAAR
ncbi:MAG: EAL domain-containing protein [Acidimicrobiales bacterium]|nr:EAL domain-containing protein [Acidimicrobiales bacterium]